MKRRAKWVGLVDADNFFVSCERLFRPDLVNKPVVVLSANDGCVVARSKEVKDIGVLMGVPYFKIKDTIKKHGITVFSANFSLYRNISDRIFKVVREHFLQVERYSIDESFFALGDDVLEALECLRLDIKKRVGIPVSVGAAPTKTIAKYATLLAKQAAGTCVLSQSKWFETASAVPVSALWGVGKRTGEKLRRHGIVTAGDLITADRLRINEIFGLEGGCLFDELNGISVLPVTDKRTERQSFSSSRSCSGQVRKLSVLEDALAHHINQLAFKLRSFGWQTSAVCLSLKPDRYAGFDLKDTTKEVKLDTPTSDTISLTKVALSALRELYVPDISYKSVGVTFVELTDENGGQPNLFTAEDRDERTELMTVLDKFAVTGEAGKIMVGSRLQKEKWQPKSVFSSPAYTTDWRQLPVVKS